MSANQTYIASGTPNICKLDWAFDPFKVGPHQRKVLDTRRRTHEQELLKTWKNLEHELQNNESTLSRIVPSPSHERINRSTARVASLKRRFESELEHMYERFKQEWLHNPSTNHVLPSNFQHHSTYLSQNVGDALRQGLAKVAQVRPTDPIEYLSYWLKHYDWMLKRNRKEAIERLLLEAEVETSLRNKALETELQHESSIITYEDSRRMALYTKREKDVSKQPISTLCPPTAQNTETIVPRYEFLASKRYAESSP